MDEFLNRETLNVRLKVRITFQRVGGPEIEVFFSDDVTPEAEADTFRVGESVLRSTLAGFHVSVAVIRRYLGPSLVSESIFHLTSAPCKFTNEARVGSIAA